MGLKKVKINNEKNENKNKNHNLGSYYGDLYGPSYLRQVYYYLHQGPFQTMQCAKNLTSYLYNFSISKNNNSIYQNHHRLPNHYTPLLTVPSSATAYAQKQTIFAVSTFLYLCTAAGLQTCVMEGFDEHAVKIVAGLHQNNNNNNNETNNSFHMDRYTVPCVVSVGYADDNNNNNSLVRSPRFSSSHFVHWNSF
ncbi:hypothetical protein AGDE_08330 [Angomonas deanei]|uniref:Nitroreductase family, putative n=1 Tax=Angomonas deanei TaxID=59799 RepID=A0A7G2CVV7_9TRYP|nr:hypothetical protein AGDE_08330 [Angomonas deanei]CAD2222452.1 Nitroreductase family, putative [Angomonas deanei]|eukprot:EPY33145.1 hypothetical protein AGDE_08330 [Angomonas deanei]